MKEYLEKQADGSYKLVMRGIVGKDDDIKVPEGAEVFMTGFNTDRGCAFYKDGFNMVHGDNWKWESCRKIDISNHAKTAWQRHIQPEELPFADDEPKYTDDEVKYMDENGQGRSQSLNDQYAEIEQVRKHRHYFKDVSNIAEIDVYAVLKLFDVTDPCLQHIVKKALCAGKRGHKDMMEDLQNIVDTAIRAVELNS